MKASNNPINKKSTHPNLSYFEFYNDKKGRDILYPEPDVVRFILSNFNRRSKIADLGCGGGRHVKLIAEKNHIPVGVDISKVSMGVVKERMNNEYKYYLACADLAALPFAEDSFDGLISVGGVLIQNTYEMITQIISEIYRVLKVDGLAFIDFFHPEDATYGFGEEIERNTFLTPGRDLYINKEDTTPDVIQHFSTYEELEELFRNFSKVKIGSYIQTYRGLKITDPLEKLAYWKVVVRK